MTPENVDAELRAFDALADPDGWAGAAATLLADLGFVVINADHPEAPSGSHLLVALRDVPTLRHFDPEVFQYYAPTREGKVTVHEVARDGLELEDRCEIRRLLWGHVHVIDRVRAENRFLTLGGDLRISAVDKGLVVLDHRSPGPIVPWGGHSQGSHDLAAEIGAFFGRLITAVDFQEGAEARLAATPPVVLYAAFLAEAGPRLQEVVRRAGLQGVTASWVARESDRIRRSNPAAWRDGTALLDELSLG